MRRDDRFKGRDMRNAESKERTGDVVHVATENSPNGMWEYGIGHHVSADEMLRGHRCFGRRAGSTTWEPWPLPGVGYGTPEHVKAGLGRSLANDCHPIEFHDGAVRAAHGMRIFEMARERASADIIRDTEEQTRIENGNRHARIDAAFAVVRFKTVTVRVPLSPGKDGAPVAPVDVHGPSVGGLVVHRTLAPTGIYGDDARPLGPCGDRFMITHAATGHALSLYFTSQRDAKVAAHRLSLLADWSVTPTGVEWNAAIALILGMRQKASPHNPYAVPRSTAKETK